MSDAHGRLERLADAYRPILERSYDDHPKRWKDIETVVAIGGRYPTVEAFLADIALDPPTEALDDIDPDDQEDEFVTVSTIHSAKGLEWNTVFLLWVNEGRLPSARSAESEESLEEERRLLYVACTRAKERLYLTYPAVMLEWHGADVLGRPSRFLDGVSQDHFPRFYLSEAP
jgi:DNA helicase-2/ATP-dependent DNA helicase PcrA